MARHRLQELPLQLLQTSLLLRITPDLIDYGATLSACEKTGQWRPGLCLLNTLRESELQPDLACFHAFMDGAGKDGWILPIHMLKLGKRETIKKMLACDDWRRISEWLASARRAQLGLRVDAISWNSALKASELGRGLSMAEAAGDPSADAGHSADSIQRVRDDEALLPDALTADAWANTWPRREHRQAPVKREGGSTEKRAVQLCLLYRAWLRPRQLASSLATTSRQRRAEPVSVGDGGGAWPRALQLVGGGAWQQSLQLLYGAPMQRLRAEAELLRGVSGSAAWPLQVKLLSSMEPKRQAFRCELYRSVGRWWAALHVWEEMEQHGLRADEVHCSSLLRACDEERVPNGWCRALALLRSLSSGVRRDPILWNALLATTSLPRGGSAAPADPRRSAWARPLVLVKAMWESAVVPDIVTFNTLLSASRWEGMLAILLQMEQMRTPIEDVAALTVVDSCAQAGQLALGRHILENIFQHVPAVLRLWSFAQLGVANASAIAAAFRHARDDERRTGLSAAEVPKVWWACGILGVNSSFSQRLAQISAGLLSRFDSAELLAITMAAATESTRAPVVTGELLAQLQWELLRRLSRDPAGSGLSALQAALQDFLGILWALHFASATSRSASARVDVLRWADLLEAEAAKVMRPTAQPLSSTAPSTSAMDVEVPQVLLELPDRMALTKPAGWEVYGDTPHQLLSYLRARDARVIDDAQHAFGFLHRLDVPSSGLILSAKTYRAYYDLQFQLVTGQILRDYLALAHGRWAPSLQQVSARLNCFEDTTRAGGQGRPSRTRTKLQSYHHFLSSSFSLLLARIDTGRRHQIRSHFAFLGHPTVSDSRYSSVATFGSDLQLCPRNFIHRYHLAFKDSLQASHQVIMPTPKDLNDCLLLFPETETLRIWLAGEVQHFDRVDAVQKCRSEFWALGIVKAVQLY
ncbi:Ribosomal large subunit pseudouridine synthase C (23S rRNA pseudouridine(955/2504/2580) synthase) (rRNA pseudouridylate synthase C) (rRNA-uridine isomerase C) [Durusdinium trenchii]|uniref:Ribosomal large subunit pseudouridine synthase C (23S rRNA pseudouridine(955/2504/2580) synthase) (rRNA pseudouridylate synthase C) (rRNA-uridine isomerase C) n=1 Tax=Durusdinium trenchii TaxID=1381693 RepID=A0ABP0N0I5_9DINO